jgi:hypothetical protein
VSVSEVDGPHVRDALVVIWLDEPETARRVRQRIVTVIDWAIAKCYRNLSLPLAAMNKSLPKSPAKAPHHNALPHAQILHLLSDCVKGCPAPGLSGAPTPEQKGLL